MLEAPGGCGLVAQQSAVFGLPAAVPDVHYPDGQLLTVIRRNILEHIRTRNPLFHLPQDA